MCTRGSADVALAMNQTHGLPFALLLAVLAPRYAVGFWSSTSFSGSPVALAWVTFEAKFTTHYYKIINKLEVYICIESEPIHSFWLNCTTVSIWQHHSHKRGFVSFTCQVLQRVSSDRLCRLLHAARKRQTDQRDSHCIFLWQPQGKDTNSHTILFCSVEHRHLGRIGNFPPKQTQSQGVVPSAGVHAVAVTFQTPGLAGRPSALYTAGCVLGVKNMEGASSYAYLVCQQC